MPSKKELRYNVWLCLQQVHRTFFKLEYWYTQLIQQINTDLSRQTEATLQIKQRKIAALETEYSQTVAKLEEVLDRAKQDCGYAELEWQSPKWKQFGVLSNKSIPCLVRLGTLEENGVYAKITMPALLPIIGGKNVLFLASGDGKERARSAIQSIILRLAATLPPGKLRLICIDPVGLGSTTAGFIKGLPDNLTGGQAWYTPSDIEQHLANLENHMAFVKQKYLGVSFANMEDYNTKAGQVEEPYRLLVVSDFPSRFSDSAAQHLISITTNGPSTGVYSLIMVDKDQANLPSGFNLKDIERTSSIIEITEQSATWIDDDFQNCKLELDASPMPADFERIIEEIKKGAMRAGEIQVPYSGLAPTEANWWQGDSRAGVRVPIGQFGAREIHYFSLDEKLLSSALVIGKAGSGKSTLLHILIEGLAMFYSPDEIELYLLDFKQVEFKDYGIYRLPHARVVAVKSEREFGLSVLSGLDRELQRRKDIFANITSLSEYRARTGQPLPRILLLADEFQELFSYDDALANQAGLILDRLIRQGRAFGINVILSSQTLMGHNTISMSTKNQVPIRIVLQCADVDSRMALSDENDRGRLLERPGEAIYNAINGRVEGNNLFQVAWMTQEERIYFLKKIRARANTERTFAGRTPLIFDGDSSSLLENNLSLYKLMTTNRWTLPNRGYLATAWLGEPIEIKDHTAAVIRRQSRSNLMIIGQNEYEEEAVGMLLSTQISLAAQHSPKHAYFVVVNLIDMNSNWYTLPDKVQQFLPHQTKILNRRQVPTAIQVVHAEVKKRSANEETNDAPAIYFFILGLHRSRDLRREEDFSPYSFNDANGTSNQVPLVKQLAAICREGPDVGIHTFLWCDTYANLGRVFELQELNEFDLRVVLQMGAEDSRNLIDCEDAAKIGSHRALFYDEEHSGKLEKFRPYGLPSDALLERLKSSFALRQAVR